MAYVTAIDVQERLGEQLFIELTDDVSSGAGDLDKVNEAIMGAEGETNSYLGRRYVVPVDLSAHSMISDVLVSFVLDLAEHRLHARRPPVSEDVRTKRREALAWLKRIADGEIVLPTATHVAESDGLSLPGQAAGSPRELSRDELSTL